MAESPNIPVSPAPRNAGPSSVGPQPAPEQRTLSLANVLQDATRSFEGKIAALTAALGALTGVISSVSKWIQTAPITTLGLLALLIASVGWLTYLGLRQRGQGALRSGWFVGVRALGAEEAAAGRMLTWFSEPALLLKKLDGKLLRCLLLVGERGCGKTSLLRTCDQLRTNYVTLFIPSGVHVNASLRVALLGRLRELGEQPDEGTGLAALLAELIRRAGERTVLLILDQAEEIFSTWVEVELSPASNSPSEVERDASERARERLRSELTELQVLLAQLVLGSSEELSRCKCIISIQRQFVGEIEGFLLDARHPAVPLQVEHTKSLPSGLQTLDRFHLSPPTVEAARQQLTDPVRSPWHRDLAERVLAEMAGGSLAEAAGTHLCLTEFQIIGQTLDSLGVQGARDYPGRQRVLRAYLSRVLAELPSLSLTTARDLLLSLLPGPNGRCPESVPEALLLQRLDGARASVLEALATLRDSFGLVERFSRNEASGRIAVFYRLGPAAAAQPLRDAIGRQADVESRTEQLVSTVLAQLHFDSHYILPIADWLWLLRHPPLQQSSELQLLMRRSRRRFLLFPCLPLLLFMLGGLLVRVGVYRLDVDNDELVLKRGLAVLTPLFGSDEVSVAAGLYLKDHPWLDSDKLPTGQALLADAKERRRFAHFLSPFGTRFSAHQQLNEQLREIANEYIEFRSKTPTEVASTDVDQTLLEWRMAIQLQGKSTLALSDEHADLLNRTYDALQRTCEPMGSGGAKSDRAEPRPTSEECDDASNRAYNIAMVLKNLKVQLAKRPPFIESFMKRITSLESIPVNSSLFYPYWRASYRLIDDSDKIEILLGRISKLLNKPFTAMSGQEVADIHRCMNSLRSIAPSIPSRNKYTIEKLAEQIKRSLKPEQYKNLRDLLLYAYAGAKFKDEKCLATAALAEKCKHTWIFNVESALGVIGLQNSDDDKQLLAVLREQIAAAISDKPTKSDGRGADPECDQLNPTAPAAPVDSTTAAKPQAPSTPPGSPPSSPVTPPPATKQPITTPTAGTPPPAPPAAAPPAAAPPAPAPGASAADKLAVVEQKPAEKLQEQLRSFSRLVRCKDSATEEKMPRAVKLLFLLRSDFLAGKALGVEEDIVRGLIQIVKRNVDNPMQDEDTIRREERIKQKDIVINILSDTISSDRNAWENRLKSNSDGNLREFLEKFFDEYMRINRQSQRSFNDSSLKTIMKALLRSGERIDDILNKVTDDIRMPLDRDESERMLQVLLESSYTVRDGQIHFDGQPRNSRGRLRTLVKRFIEQLDDESAAWCGLALYFRIAPEDIEDRIDAVRPNSTLSRSYARRRLLQNTDGFIQIYDLPAMDSDRGTLLEGGPHNDKPTAAKKRKDDDESAETPSQAGERLLDALFSQRALQHSAYRDAVVEALRLLARSPQSVEVRVPLQVRIEKLLGEAHKYPFPVLLSLWRVLQELRTES